MGHQHGVNWIHDGSPGAGNLILFNNHHNNNNSGAVIEIETPVDENGHYPIEDGEPWGPESFIMVYDDVDTDMQGGAFRQPNGNTLITEGDYGIWEVTNQKDVVWKYKNPDFWLWRAYAYDKDDAAISNIGL